jgi:phosphoadenosine phosphosulfate reductase
MHSLTSQHSHKLAQSKMVIEDALDTYPTEQMLIAWSAGKDSTLVLKLLLEVCTQRGVKPPRALDIDQHDQFEELTTFRDNLVNDWQVDLLLVKNTDFLDKVTTFGDRVNVETLDVANRQALNDIGYDQAEIIWQPESPVCNHLLKTVPINQALIDHGIQAMFTGIRWDEHGARESETYFSEREKPAHMRIHPILHLSERDIWDIHFALDIPYNGLYQQGYRSLGTKSGTKKHADIPAWEQDLENTSERDARSEEKEKVMAQLRAWGYM